MSKSIGLAFKAHLASAVTTIAVCWKIVRKFDGAVYAFTSFDDDLVIDGLTYLSVVGFSRSNVATGSDGHVDNVEVVGFLSDDGITERDIVNGLYDYSAVHLFAVNWTDLSQGMLKMRRGWLGECTTSPNGEFLAELRGMTQELVQEFGNVWSPLCRADLGDSLCKIPIKPADWAAGTDYAAGDYVQALTQDTDAKLVAIFQAQGAGTSDIGEPTWDPVIGNSSTDNDITWVSKPYFRALGTCTATINQKSFQSSGVTVPALGAVVGNIGAVAFTGEVSDGTTLSISDGINTYEIIATSDTNAELALRIVYTQLIEGVGGLNASISLAGRVIFITINTGLTGSIIKTGDTNTAIAIQNFNDATLDLGTLTWISGDNLGVTMEVKYFDSANVVNFWLAMKFPIQVGDRFLYYPGCNKRRDTCLKKFNNILNNRSEPDMPGIDWMLTYPDAAS